jgi:type IV secretory pathway TrbL component
MRLTSVLVALTMVALTMVEPVLCLLIVSGHHICRRGASSNMQLTAVMVSTPTLKTDQG